jgi:signal transduction histidine kinase
MHGSIQDDVTAISRIDAVPSILAIACRTTGMRFAAVARVTETRWIACAVRDEIEFGLKAGGELDLETTICDEIRCSGNGVIIDHVAEDPHFHDHHTPRQYGFQSYISIPICHADGTFFGTLCALDPLPAKVSNPKTIATFESLAQLIGLQLDAQDKLRESEAALSEAESNAGLREQFIAILGHDLRNPVAAIDAGATMLAKAPLDPRSARIVDQMKLSCGRITNLINDILDFARGRLGTGLVLSRGPAQNLEASIEQVISELQTVHPEREIRVTVDLPETVTCDVERVTQLLSNLLGNALTHGAPDSPVEISARSSDGSFVLSVANAGEPIPGDKTERLFQPFTQSAEGSSPNGLGLGLYIASEIAKAHDGSLAVTSDEGETRFTLTMPCNCG